MAQGVVDALELIEIHEQHRQAVPAAPRLRQGLGQAVVEQQTVGKPGERVMIGLVGDQALGLLALEGAGEDLAHDAQQRDAVLAPVLLLAPVAKAEHAAQRAAEGERHEQQRA